MSDLGKEHYSAPPKKGEGEREKEVKREVALVKERNRK